MSGSELEDFAQQIADQVESFLVALQAITREADPGRAVSLLLLEASQLLLAGARLGAQTDFTPHQKYQPDVGPDPDLDAMRLGLATMLGTVDTYSYNFDPYDPELVTAQLSDDLAAVASDVANGLRLHRAGHVDEALWWWQFSYVNSWGSVASAVLRALQSIVAHDRLDKDFAGEAEQINLAGEMLEGEPAPPR
jgi:hypothetical protein